MGHEWSAARTVRRRRAPRGPWPVAALFAGVLMVGACAASQSVPPGASSSATLEHPTGATDVVLRLDEAGGATTPMFAVIQPPTFTLYGDGTVIARDVSHGSESPDSVVATLPAFRHARLTESQVQAVLADALVAGGLGSARPEYIDARVVDPRRAVFTVDAGAMRKSVTVNGLDVEIGDGQDVAARAAFRSLAQRLRSIETDATLQSQPYEPMRFRAYLLTDPSGVVPVGARPWPWADLKPSDFAMRPGSEDPVHVLTEAQVQALGVNGYQGGFQGLGLTGPGGVGVYALQLRPLLPDEPE